MIEVGPNQSSEIKVLTWQELATAVPPGLREFLDEKYGITHVADHAED
jgi:hypothetical protein